VILRWEETQESKKERADKIVCVGRTSRSQSSDLWGEKRTNTGKEVETSRFGSLAWELRKAEKAEREIAGDGTYLRVRKKEIRVKHWTRKSDCSTVRIESGKQNPEHWHVWRLVVP